jgi:hypothetical protein
MKSKRRSILSNPVPFFEIPVQKSLSFAKFVVKWKLIANEKLNSRCVNIKKRPAAIHYSHMAKRSAFSSQKNPRPPLHIDTLQWRQLDSEFDPRTIHDISRIMGNLLMTAL